MSVAGRVAHRLWRESATLIIIGRNATMTRDVFDYRVLLLQRSSKSRFMPGNYVFPGGVIDEADFADEWMDLYRNSFKAFGTDFQSLLDIKGPRPPIFQNSHTSVPCEVAFRICAIRETFEESGVLLIKKIPERNTMVQESSKGRAHVFDQLSNLEIKEWRQDVHNDPTKFFSLCKYLNSVPDVWSLSEWTNWLTPSHMKIRFDTAFFICFSDHELSALHDEGETIHSQWKTPGEALIDNFTTKNKLGFPQLYTMLQLCRMTKWSKLKAFQQNRVKEGCSRSLVVRIKCSDAIISVFPGDDLYPKALDYISKCTHGNYGIKDDVVPMETYTDTCEELEAGVTQFHRAVQKSDRRRPIMKINCSLGHGMPVPLTDIDTFMKLVNVCNTQSKM